MNLKGRVNKIETEKQPTVRVQMCFRNPSETEEEAKNRVSKDNSLIDDWLIVQWL